VILAIAMGGVAYEKFFIRSSEGGESAIHEKFFNYENVGSYKN